MLEQLVQDNLLVVEKRSLAKAQGAFHNGIPTIMFVVENGLSKQSHKNSYKGKLGVGVIFGADTSFHWSTKQALFSQCYQ